MVKFMEYVLFGALIGLISGIFGIGGSSISTPLLKTIFNLPDLIALASPLPVTIPTAIAGTFNYWRRGLVRKDLVLWTTLGGMPGIILGALGTKVVAGRWLMVLTGIFVLLIGIRLRNKDRGYRSRVSQLSKRSLRVLMLTIGLIIGLLSGLLANGGGVLLVPAFILLLGIQPHEAASSSLVCVAILAIPGTLTHWWLGNIDWRLVLELSIGVIPASYLGSKLGLAVGGERIKLAFAYFLIAFGIAFILAQFGLPLVIVDIILGGAIAMIMVMVILGINKGEEEQN